MTYSGDEVKAGEIYDAVCGSFLIVGLDTLNSDSISLTDDQLLRYTSMFYNPEILIDMGGKLRSIAVSPDVWDDFYGK